MSEAADLVRIVGLRASYPDGTEALRGVDLSLPAGGRLALLGANGSGKTSLLLTMMGGLPIRGGRVEVAGVSVGPGTLNQVRRRCGMLFQQPDDQLFMPTLLEDAAFGPLNHGQPPAKAAELAKAALAGVGLAGLEGRSGHHLSEGQKRSACLATVLSMQVELLLLDEPTANLDARGRAKIARLLAERPESMIVATHDLELAGLLCDQAIILNAGQAAAAGAAQDLLAQTDLLEQHGLICPL